MVKVHVDWMYLQKIAAEKNIEVWWNDLYENPNLDAEVILIFKGEDGTGHWCEACDTARTAIDILEGRNFFGNVFGEPMRSSA